MHHFSIDLNSQVAFIKKSKSTLTKWQFVLATNHWMFRHFFFLIGKSSLPWEIVCLWEANLKIIDLKSLNVCLCVCLFDWLFIFSFFSIYGAWYCQEVYACRNCMRTMNCALRDLEWGVLLMLHLEEWWVRYKSTCFWSKCGLLIISD